MRKLEDIFDMDPDPIEPAEQVEQAETSEESNIISIETLETIEKVELALPQVRGLESSDKEMDELSGLAKDAFQNLMDLGMQVEARFSSEIFNSAATMLGHAITAKTAKVNKKLKMIDLQLKKADLQRKIDSTPDGKSKEIPLGNAQPMDRNEVLKAILNRAAANKSENDK